MDSNPVQEVLSVWPNNTEAVDTFEVQLRSKEEENGYDLDQVRPLRLGPIYRLVGCEPSSLLTVKVEVT